MIFLYLIARLSLITHNFTYNYMPLVHRSDILAPLKVNTEKHILKNKSNHSIIQYYILHRMSTNSCTFTEKNLAL